MENKTTNPEKEYTKFEISFVPEDDNKALNSKSHQRDKICRTVKLPRLKLENLVSQITEENAHSEISTGQAIGIEVSDVKVHI